MENTIRTIDDVIKFINMIRELPDCDQIIKSVSFECDGPNHIKKFNIEYFSFEVPINGGVKIK